VNKYTTICLELLLGAKTLSQVFFSFKKCHKFERKITWKNLLNFCSKIKQRHLILNAFLEYKAINLPTPGVDVMITIFYFLSFSAKNGVFLKNQCYDPIFA
jgi:hypothetical protein